MLGFGTAEQWKRYKSPGAATWRRFVLFSSEEEKTYHVIIKKVKNGFRVQQGIPESENHMGEEEEEEGEEREEREEESEEEDGGSSSNAPPPAAQGRGKRVRAATAKAAEAAAEEDEPAAKKGKKAAKKGKK